MQVTQRRNRNQKANPRPLKRRGTEAAEVRRGNPENRYLKNKSQTSSRRKSREGARESKKINRTSNLRRLERRDMCNFKDETVSERATEYATGDDFCRVFAEDMDRLYSLALLLSADEEKAEQCFVAALDDCLKGNAVFKDWTHSWSKRAVIKQAIGVILPAPRQGKSSAIIRDEGAGSE